LEPSFLSQMRAGLRQAGSMMPVPGIAEAIAAN
jgi:hypothetical protein